MSAGARRAKTPILATLGPAGTHSEAAARIYARTLSEAEPFLCFGTPQACLVMVKSGEAEEAVLPAENAIDGLIGPTFDALIDFCPDITVHNQLVLPVQHVLAGRPGLALSRIATIFSHPSALNQCARRLAELAPEARHVPLGSTAEAAWHIARDTPSDAAAVCSAAAAQAAGLRILAEDIGDYPDNQTRFIVCGRQTPAPTGEDATILAVHYGEDRPGQLYQTAGAFAIRGIDLCSVHSRPYRGRAGRYVLLFELIGHAGSPDIMAALAEIEAMVAKTGGWVRVLGSYPARGGVG